MLRPDHWKNGHLELSEVVGIAQGAVTSKLR
jgi:hypothetical protein